MKERGESLSDSVAEKAYTFEQVHSGCGQAVLAAFKQEFGFISDDLFRAGTGLSAGLGLTGNTCGAFLASCLVLGVIVGRDYNDLADTERKRYRTFAMVREFCQRFLRFYPSLKCQDIQESILGRSYDLWDIEQKKEFEMAGGHSDKCPGVCGNAARWATEILLKEGLIYNAKRGL